MLKWLKVKLRNWLLEEDNGHVSVHLDILVDGKIERVMAIKSVGLHLICQGKDGSQKMITESDVMNQSHFMKLRGYLSKDKLTWSDGTPYNPLV